MKIIGIMNELYNNNKLENKRFKTPDGMILDNVSDLLKYVGVLNDEWFSLNDIIDSLNDEIEIIEEVDDKEYEDIDIINGDYVVPNTPATENEAYIMACFLAHEQILNTLIRNQKYILERLDKNDK